MTHGVPMVLTLLVSIVAPAVAQTAGGAGERAAPSGAGSAEVSGSPAYPLFVDLSPVLWQVAPPPPPPRPRTSPRRRGSMVGYIEDPVVSSKIRVRFDAGFHSDTPDRAEFFYGKCGCYRDAPVGDPARDVDAAGPGPGQVTDLNFQQLYVQGEYAAAERLSVFAELPIRWLQPQSFAGAASFGDQSGIGDLRAGVKLALADRPDQMLTAQVKGFFPTGDSRSGLGTDHWSVEPGILYYRQLSDRVAVEAQVSLWIPFGGSNGVPTAVDDKFAGEVLSYGIGPSFELYRSGDVRFAPVVELVGWHVLSGFQTSLTLPADATGTDIVNLKFGARVSWGRGGSIYVGYGHAITEADWYDDIVRFEYRFSF